jgi:hypothetical protein
MERGLGEDDRLALSATRTSATRLPGSASTRRGPSRHTINTTDGKATGWSATASCSF